MAHLRWPLIRITLSVLAAVTAVASLVYVLGEPEHFQIQFRRKYVQNLTLVRFHGVSSAIALLLGPVQMWLVARKGAWHLGLGRVYLISMLIGGATGIPMANLASGGLTSRVGYALMALLWIGTGLLAFRSIRNGEVGEHQVWMTRNIALSFGAVVLRLYLYLVQKAGLSFLLVYPSAVWLCWGACLLLGELAVLKRDELPSGAECVSGRTR